MFEEIFMILVLMGDGMGVIFDYFVIKILEGFWFYFED